MQYGFSFGFFCHCTWTLIGLCENCKSRTHTTTLHKGGGGQLTDRSPVDQLTVWIPKVPCFRTEPSM